MASDEPLLAIDTSAAHCAVALVLKGKTHIKTKDMSRGQAEHLMPMVLDLLSGHGIAVQDIARIGVGVGPGNFTGIRISVSAARGLALGLGVPAVGITSLDALRHAHKARNAAVPAPRDMAYLQVENAAPVLVNAADVPPDTAWLGKPDILIRAIADLAALSDRDGAAPAPLYVKPADAAPPREAPPIILQE